MHSPKESQTLFDIEWMDFITSKYTPDGLFLAGNLIDDDWRTEQTVFYRIEIDENWNTTRYLADGLRREMIILDPYNRDL